jgi:hypothetical protein
VTQNLVGEREVLVISMLGKKGSGMPFLLASFSEKTSGMAFQHVPSQKIPLVIEEILKGITHDNIHNVTFIR